MRIFVTLLFMAFLSQAQLCAQEVYNLVLANATRTVNSPTASYTQTQIAQFKRTALIYMKSKAFEVSETVSSEFLDTQAYFMSEFITLFFNEFVKIKKLPDAERKERILSFMEISITHPLFHDPDEETTLSFIKDGGEITPFSLDTNWKEAFEAAEQMVKAQ